MCPKRPIHMKRGQQTWKEAYEYEKRRVKENYERNISKRLNTWEWCSSPPYAWQQMCQSIKCVKATNVSKEADTHEKRPTNMERGLRI